MQNILLLGTALVDHLIYSEEPLKKDSCNKLPNHLSSGGSIRNIAYNLGVLGVPATFLSVWGQDEQAEKLKKQLHDVNIPTFGPSIALDTPIFTAISTPDLNLLISGLTPDFLLTASFPFNYEDYDFLVTNSDDEVLLKTIIHSNPKIKLISISNLPAAVFREQVAGIIINRHELARQVGKTDYREIAGKYFGWLIVSEDSAGLSYYNGTASGHLANRINQKDGYAIGCGDVLAAGIIAKLYNRESFFAAVNFGHNLAEDLYLKPDSTL